MPSTTTAYPPNAYPAAEPAITSITTSFWARDSGNHGGSHPLLMKCQNVSVSRWTPRSWSSARRRATVVLPAPVGR